jgi:tetratricopeptide (TPR) repeat protein
MKEPKLTKCLLRMMVFFFLKTKFSCLEALKDFDIVVQLQPRNAKAYFRRAFCYKSLDRFDEAAGDFETARKLDPENPMYLVNYKKIVLTDVIELEEPGDEL